jgi:hypothetical protein
MFNSWLIIIVNGYGHEKISQEESTRKVSNRASLPFELSTRRMQRRSMRNNQQLGRFFDD